MLQFCGHPRYAGAPISSCNLHKYTISHETATNISMFKYRTQSCVGQPCGTQLAAIYQRTAYISVGKQDVQAIQNSSKNCQGTVILPTISFVLINHRPTLTAQLNVKLAVIASDTSPRDAQSVRSDTSPRDAQPVTSAMTRAN